LHVRSYALSQMNPPCHISIHPVTQNTSRHTCECVIIIILCCAIEKVAEKIPCTNITRYYLRRHLHRFIGSRRHLCPKSPETFESKLGLFWLKEP